MQYSRIWNNYLERNEYKDTILEHGNNRIKFHELICRHIKKIKNPRIIELGCGTCIDTNIIAKRRNFGSYFALDISKNSISLALRINKDFKNFVNLLIGDTVKLPLKDQSFDLVFSQGLVEHFSNPDDVIKEQIRILKSNGILVVNVPQKFTGYTLYKKRMIRRKIWDLGWEREFSCNELKNLGQSLGLKEVETVGYQYWKSWQEPTFVLRDLYDKFHRRNPLKNHKIFFVLRKWYECFWKKIERTLGSFFLQNLVMVFEKNSDEDISCKY